MTPTDVFLLLVRWLHVVAAVAWVGGNLFYLLVLVPALRKPDLDLSAIGPRIAARFRVVVDGSIVILVLTGVILAMDRLTSSATGVPYVAVLGAKAALVLWMFALAWTRRRSSLARIQAETQGKVMQGRRRLFSGAALLPILGVVVLFLSDLLRALFEQGLAS